MKYENTPNKIKNLWTNVHSNVDKITKSKKVIINLDNHIIQINKNSYFNRIIRTFNTDWEAMLPYTVISGVVSVSYKYWEIKLENLSNTFINNIRYNVLYDESFDGHKVYTYGSWYYTEDIIDIKEIRKNNGEIDQNKVDAVLKIMVYFGLDYREAVQDCKVKLLVSLYNPTMNV